MIYFNHVKLKYIETQNVRTKRALVSKPSTLLAPKDPNISYYLNLSLYLPTIILAIIQYIPNMTVPHKWTRIRWQASQVNLLSLGKLLLLINKLSLICERPSCRVRIKQN